MLDPYGLNNYRASMALLDVKEAEQKVENSASNVIISTKGIIFKYDNQSLSFFPDHAQYNELESIALSTYKTGVISKYQWSVIQDYYLSTNFPPISYKDLTVSLKGASFKGIIQEDVSNYLVREFKEKKLNQPILKAWYKFFQKLIDVPHKDVYERLFKWLSPNNLKINEDGDIVLFKIVTQNFKDRYSESLDYSVGSEVSLPKYNLNSDPFKDDPIGLHAYEWKEIVFHSKTNDRVIFVAIDPRDVITVPLPNKSSQKLKASKIKVLRDVGTWNVDLGVETNLLKRLTD